MLKQGSANGRVFVIPDIGGSSRGRRYRGTGQLRIFFANLRNHALPSTGLCNQLT